MKYTDLNIFYQLGSALTYMVENVATGNPAVDLYIKTHMATKWLESFRIETAELSDTLRDTNEAVANYLTAIYAIRNDIEKNFDRPVTQEQVQTLFRWKDEFEQCFEREHRSLDIFTVTPKGLYNTRLLIESPENDFPVALRPFLPKQTLYDVQQAARCLAFDLPTACAFHVCRGTESLMLAYYAKLAKHAWNLPKNRDWSAYLDHLVKEGAPAKITDRLREIKDSDRNALIHPDINVRPEEAQVLFKLCAAVNFYMAEELSKP